MLGEENTVICVQMQQAKKTEVEWTYLKNPTKYSNNVFVLPDYLQKILNTGVQ